MAEAHIDPLMVMSTRGSTRITRSTAVEAIDPLVVLCMTGSTRMERAMAEELIDASSLGPSTVASGRITRGTAEARINTLMEMFTRVSGEMISHTKSGAVCVRNILAQYIYKYSNY